MCAPPWSWTPAAWSAWKLVSDLLLAKQAQGGPGVENVNGKVERMKSDTVQLYERLARLGEVVSLARKEEGSVATDRTFHLI